MVSDLGSCSLRNSRLPILVRLKMSFCLVILSMVNVSVRPLYYTLTGLIILVYVCTWTGVNTVEEHLKAGIIAKGWLNNLREVQQFDVEVEVILLFRKYQGEHYLPILRGLCCTSTPNPPHLYET